MYFKSKRISYVCLNAMTAVSYRITIILIDCELKRNIKGALTISSVTKRFFKCASIRWHSIRPVSLEKQTEKYYSFFLFLRPTVWFWFRQNITRQNFSPQQKITFQSKSFHCEIYQLQANRKDSNMNPLQLWWNPRNW